MIFFKEGFLMDEAVMTAITSGFTTIAEMVKDIVIVGVPAAVGIIGVTAGAKYGIKWVKGLLSKAS